ncbi:MAG: nucleotidyltransferase family protein [Holosporales bacterium]
MTKTLAELMPILREAKGELMARYPITEMGVFGSYARGQADKDSDLDILYSMDSGNCSLFDIVDIQLYLQHKTGIPRVDVVNKKRLRRFLAPYILQEAVYL